MALYPNAQWRPVCNFTAGHMRSYSFLILHIMEGTLTGTESDFNNPALQKSAHFGVGKDGTVYQWVDTGDKAWAQIAGNAVGVSIEHEGHTPDALTQEQIDADAGILAWINQVHGIPLQVTDDPVIGTGVCGHSTGAGHLWGHAQCPGPAIMDQRQQIIDAATVLLGGRPIVLGVSPTAGSASGGDTVTVTGVGLAAVTAVTFGSTAGSDVAVQSATALTVTSPPPSASGAVDVTVTTAAGLTSGTCLDDLFTYDAADPQIPTVTGLAPRVGAAGGGDTVTITGTSLSGATAVQFGQDPGGDVTVVSDTQLTVTSPPPTVSGAVSVSVTTPMGTSPSSAASQFTIADPEVLPAVSSIAPTGGSSAGGDTVTVTGTGLTAALSVTFGSDVAGDLTVVDDTRLTVTSPPASVSGAVDVVVYSGTGFSATSSDDQFTYG